MTIEAELPDGRVLEFPDGTEQAVIQRVVREQLGVDGGGWGDPGDKKVATGIPLVLNELAQVPAGFNDALGDVVDLPSRVVTPMLNPVREAVGLDPITPESEPAIASLGETIKAANYAVPEPETALGRINRRVGQELGFTVPFAAFPLIGVQAINASARATSMGGRALLEALRPFARSPMLTTIGEAASAVGAGLLGGAAREAFPDSDIAETAGQVAGGIIPGLMPVTVASRLGARALRGQTEQAVNSEAQRAVADALGGRLTPETDQALRDSREVVEKAPGFKPSIAERSGDAALVATQEGIEQGMSGGELDAAVARRTENERAVDQFGKRRAPQAAPQPAFIVDTASGRIDDIRARAGRLSEAAGEKQRSLAEARLPQADRAGQGEVVRERLKSLRGKARADMGRRAAELGIEDIPATDQFLDWASSVDEALAPTSVFQDAKKRPESMVDIDRVRKKIAAQQKARDEAIAKGAEPPEIDEITFNDVKALRERLTDDLLDETGSANPSRKRVRQLSILRARVDDLVEDIGKSIDDPELAQRYGEFRKTYFEEYIQRFERGVAFKVQQKQRGFYRTPDEKVAETFFQPGNVTAARQYRSTFGDDPEAQGAMVATVLDSLRSNVVKDGVIDQKAFDAWQKKHASVLAEMPEIGQVVSDISTANGALTARQQQITARTALINDQKLVKALDKFTSADKSPEAVIQTALSDPRLMKRMVGILRRDPDALASLKRHIWDEATSGNAGDMTAYIQKHGDALQVVLGGDHMKDIATIFSAKEMMERVRTPRGQAVEPRPGEFVERQIGQGIPQLGSRIFAFKSGRMQKGYLVLDTALRGLRGRAAYKAEDMLKAALYDEDVARSMANIVMTGKPRDGWVKRIRSHIFDVGYGATVRGGLMNVGSPLRSEESEKNLEPALP